MRICLCLFLRLPVFAEFATKEKPDKFVRRPSTDPSDPPVTVEQFKEATGVLPRPMCTCMLACTFTCKHAPKACARVCSHKLVQTSSSSVDKYRRTYLQTRIHTDACTYRRVHHLMTRAKCMFVHGNREIQAPLPCSHTGTQ